MPLAKSILRLLPRLRRFGQMLLGRDNKRVDQAIQQCLKSIIDDPTSYASGEGLEIKLFALIVHALARQHSGAENEPTDPGVDNGVDPALVALTFVERQTFLLRHIEEFSRSDTAHIMQVTARRVQELEQQINRKLSA